MSRYENSYLAESAGYSNGHAKDSLHESFRDVHV